MLSEYHKKYANRPQEEIDRRVKSKKAELEQVKKQLGLEFSSRPLRVAVLGCGDKRFVGGHRQIFLEVFGLPVELTTFDLTVEHLEGETGIVQHDCTLPLPGGPYDITYAHVLLKFINPAKQWDVVKNSYDALRNGGVAMHFMDKGGGVRATEMVSEGMEGVNLVEMEQKLKEHNITFHILDIKIGPEQTGDGTCLVLQKL